MSADLIPFPRSRDRRFTRHVADKMAMASTAAEAERHLSNQLGVLEARLSKAGVTPAAISSELSSTELAIRAQLWRAVLTPGGAA